MNITLSIMYTICVLGFGGILFYRISLIFNYNMKRISEIYKEATKRIDEAKTLEELEAVNPWSQLLYNEICSYWNILNLYKWKYEDFYPNKP